MNKKKKIWSFLFMLVIFVITCNAIFKKNDLSEICYWIGQIKIEYLVVSMLIVPIFVCCESVILCYLMKHIGVKLSLGRSFVYSFVGFFYSCITPSASGGQPAQILYMKKDNIDFSESSIVLLIITIAYKLVLVFFGGIVLFFKYHWLHRYMGKSISFCYLGMFLNLICIFGMGFMVFSKKLAPYLVCRGERAFVKFGFLKKSEERKKKISGSMLKYKSASVFLNKNKGVLLPVLLITFVQRILIFFVTYLIYMAFQLKGTSMSSIIILQAMISLSVDMLPVPGGMGVSEGLFVHIYRLIFGQALVVPAMLLSRWVSFYVLLFVSGAVTFISHIVYRKRDKRILYYEKYSISEEKRK